MLTEYVFSSAHTLLSVYGASAHIYRLHVVGDLVGNSVSDRQVVSLRYISGQHIPYRHLNYDFKFFSTEFTKQVSQKYILTVELLAYILNRDY